MSQLRIGISGWTYPPWRGVFYPKGLKQKAELNYASRQFNSIEINGTFYALQKPASFLNWYNETPKDFVFSVKAGRFITHILRLKNCETPVANFFACGILALQEKLGPVLWQFPPFMKLKDDRFAKFLALLPKTTGEAAELAGRHDDKVQGQVFREIKADRPLRHAFEMRHASFLHPDFLAMLKENGVAFVMGDSSGEWPYTEDLTADFVYLRLHGLGEAYENGYPEPVIADWEKKVRAWTRGQDAEKPVKVLNLPPDGKSRDAFIYFDNDAKARAPFDAQVLMKKLGVQPLGGEE